MKWYQNNLKLFFAILFVAPLGIYGLIKRQTSKKTLKIISIIVVGFYTIFFGMVSLGIIISLFTDSDKVHYDYGVLKKKEKQYEAALKEFALIDEKSEYYKKAQSLIPAINKSVDSLKLVEVEIFNRQNEENLKIENERIKWSDSIVKSWNGQFIIDYKKPIVGDTIYFYLSKNASKSFNSNKESNLPLYTNSYKENMQQKFGNEYNDKTVIDFLQDEQTKNELIEKSRRKDLIMNQFGFKGQHRKLEREIKAMMNDPDSYEHVATTWEDKGSYILIETSIRGTNPYGAKIIKTYRAKATVDGQVLEIK